MTNHGSPGRTHEAGHLAWQYDQRPSRGRWLRYRGTVHLVEGGDASRVRRELAAVVRDLLDWSARSKLVDGRIDANDHEDTA